MKKHLSALLAFLMLASVFTACSSDTSSGNSDTQAAGNDTVQAEAAEETTLDGRAGAKDNIPDDFTMNGKTVGIYSRGDNMRLYDIDGGGEETGDMVYDAVYRRTRSVEDRLDVKFNIMCIDGKWADFGNGMEQNILAGDDTWQIIFTTGNAAIQSSRDYLFQDLSGNKYIDIEQPWWSAEAIKEISLDGKQIKYLVGDIALYNYLKAGALYFNKNLYKDVYGSDHCPVGLVLDFEE